MRYIFYFLFIISQSVSCQVTTTLPYDTIEYPNGAYLKDLNNEFPFWVDTWEGTVNNKKYTFTILMFQQHLETYPNGEYHYRDRLTGKLKVTDIVTGQIIYDESSFTNFDSFIIKGIIILGSKFYFGQHDKENHCYNNVSFMLEKNPNNPNQITYKGFSYNEYEYRDCPYTSQEDIPMFLPKVNLVLTRQ